MTKHTVKKKKRALRAKRPFLEEVRENIGTPFRRKKPFGAAKKHREGAGKITGEYKRQFFSRLYPRS
jgi:hypothetical protein